MPGKELVPRPAVQPPAVPGQPPWVRDKPERVTAWTWLYRRRHWTLPLFLMPAIWALALILRVSGQAKPALWAGAALSVVIVAFGRLKWDRAAEHAYAAASSVSLMLWLWLATMFGPMDTGWLGVPWLLVFLGAGVITWGGFWWAHKRPRGQRKRAKRIAKWDEWWQSHAWQNFNLGGSKLVDVWEMGLTTKVEIAGLPGKHTIELINRIIPNIESGLDGHADIGMVRAEAVPKKPSHFYLYFKRENPLAQAVEYDPALAPRSVHEPIAMGLTETGKWHVIPARCNRWTLGASRTGKSNDLLVGVAALTGCADDWQILIDLKGGRSGRPILEVAAAGYVITEVDEARMLLRMLKAEIKARGSGAYAGEEQLHATETCPALHLLIDETHGLTSVANGDSECAGLLGDVASMGKGLEIYVWVYTQYGSLEESVRTPQTRANLNVRTCYRVEDARDASYAIPEWNKLDASKLEEQGTCYIKNGPKVLAEQVRAPKMSHPLLKRIAAQNARMIVRPPLVLYCGEQDAGNGQTWQAWWDTRWLRLDPAFHGISPQYQAAVASSPATAFAARPAPPPPSPSPEPGTGDGASVAARMVAELDGVPDTHPPKVNLGRVIRTEVERFVAALEAAPAAGISPAQLMDESGRGSSWVHERLKALVDLGAVTQVGRGLYVPVPGAGIAAALETIKDRNDRLYREARSMVNAA